MIKYVTSKELGNCPAAVDMRTGDIEINKSVWHRFSEFERKFILKHEEGHYILKTDDEATADLYALRQCYKTGYQSLKRSLNALYKIGVIDLTRIEKLYIEGLKIDWEDNGNVKARQELEKLTSMKQKLTTGGDPFWRGGNYKNKATGSPEEERIVTTPAAADILTKADDGIYIKGKYLSFTNIILLGILITLFLTYKKQK